MQGGFLEGIAVGTVVTNGHDACSIAGALTALFRVSRQVNEPV